MKHHILLVGAQDRGWLRQWVARNQFQRRDELPECDQSFSTGHHHHYHHHHQHDHKEYHFGHYHHRKSPVYAACGFGQMLKLFTLWICPVSQPIFFVTTERSLITSFIGLEFCRAMGPPRKPQASKPERQTWNPHFSSQNFIFKPRKSQLTAKSQWKKQSGEFDQIPMAPSSIRSSWASGLESRWCCRGFTEGGSSAHNLPPDLNWSSGLKKQLVSSTNRMHPLVHNLPKQLLYSMFHPILGWCTSTNRLRLCSILSCEDRIFPRWVKRSLQGWSWQTSVQVGKMSFLRMAALKTCPGGNPECTNAAIFTPELGG